MTTATTCDFPPCNQPAEVKGACRRHYYQRYNGRPLTMPDAIEKTTDVDAMRAAVEAAGGVICASCDRATPGQYATTVDGDLLCPSCSAILAAAGDDPGVIESAALYLLDLRARRRAVGKKKAKKHAS